MNPRSKWPKEEGLKSEFIPLLSPTIAYCPSGSHHSANLMSDLDYLKGFSDYELMVLVLGVQNGKSKQCMNTDKQIFPRNVVHDKTTGRAEAQICEHHPEGKEYDRPLGSLFGSLFPNGKFNPNLFGCPDCDITAQVRLSIPYHCAPRVTYRS